MRVLGIAGYSGSGKTTLIVRLIPLLRARGLSVATVKHAHHRFDPLLVGHPALRWREAGAREIVWSDPRSRLHLHELRDEPEPPLEDLMARLSPVDLLLVEGFKFGTQEKIEVFRRSVGATLLAAGDPRVIALASDCGRPAGLPPARSLPIFSVDDVTAIAAFVADWCRGDGAAGPEARFAHHAAAQQ